MKVIVTGASGFLGAAVIRALTRTGAQVIGVSRRTGGNWQTVASYADAPDGDALIHLAEDSLRSRVNAAGSTYFHEALATLSRLLDKKYDRVVYASSAVLYGDHIVTPRCVGEPIIVNDTYTKVKAAAEVAVCESGHIAARLGNLYGPGMSQTTVIGTIMSQLDGDSDLVVLDDSPVRDFLWIDDAAKAMAALALSRHSGIVNIGTGVGTTVRELALLILRARGQPSRHVRSGKPSARASTLVLDIHSTLAAIDWRPTISLDEGLRQLLRTQ